jgi:hypothetical protein
MRLSSAFTVVMTATSFTSFIVLSQEPMETCTFAKMEAWRMLNKKKFQTAKTLIAKCWILLAFLLEETFVIAFIYMLLGASVLEQSQDVPFVMLEWNPC